MDNKEKKTAADLAKVYYLKVEKVNDVKKQIETWEKCNKIVDRILLRSGKVEIALAESNNNSFGFFTDEVDLSIIPYEELKALALKHLNKKLVETEDELDDFILEYKEQLNIYDRFKNNEYI